MALEPDTGSRVRMDTRTTLENVAVRWRSQLVQNVVLRSEVVSTASAPTTPLLPTLQEMERRHLPGHRARTEQYVKQLK